MIIFPWIKQELQEDVYTERKNASKEKYRIIGVIDVDSFECQIYFQECPRLIGVPAIVADVCGRNVSVSPEAKLLGITRNWREEKVRAVFPGRVFVFKKPQLFNKPDSSKTREASWKITDVITAFLNNYPGIVLQHVASDQWYFDLTDYLHSKLDDEDEGFVCPTFGTNDKVVLEDGDAKGMHKNHQILYKMRSVESENNAEQTKFYRHLIEGGNFIDKIRKHISVKTGFNCSGGVAINLLQAKLACNFNKPGTVTMLTESGLKRIAKDIEITSIPGFRKKLGSDVQETLNIQTMNQMRGFPVNFLVNYFDDKEATFIHESAWGICSKQIIAKTMTQEINSAKHNLDIYSYKGLRYHLNNLCADIIKRLKEERNRNNRIAKALKIRDEFYYNSDQNKDVDSSEMTVELNRGNRHNIRLLTNDCFAVFGNFNPRFHTIVSLTLKVTKNNFVYLS